MDKKDLEVKQNLVKGVNEVLSKAILDSSEAEILKLSDNFQKVIESKLDDTFVPETLNSSILDAYKKKWEQNTDEILGLRLNSFPTIERAIDGIQPGFIVVGADANVGKTGLLISLATDIIKSNDKAFVIFVSADDVQETILTRMIANVGNTTKINNIKKLGYYKNDKKESKNIHNAIATTEQKICNKVAIYDTERIRSFSDIERAIQAHEQEGRKIVICIDALLNLEIDKESLEVRMENERRAVLSKNIVKKYKVPVITTAELKKPTSKGKEDAKPTIHDIAETRKYSFEADAILLLRNKNNIETKTESESIEIICDIAKNKLSHIRKECELEYHVTKSWMREKKPGNTQNDTKKTSYENLSDEELINTA
jgi:replicative DNA helicase